MKKFDSRTYSISDFVEWHSEKKLLLNPTFQRRAVWSDKAKSYLMDTIIRGKPIPKIFIRQVLDVLTKSSTRDVIDGQQRLRTILSFMRDGFPISKLHNEEFGGMLFSELPNEVQEQILSFEISVDQLVNLPDSEVLDIFGRLNSYAVILNEQEKINANHFSLFKLLSDEIGRDYNKFWIENRILTENKILRMDEVNLVADILIAMQEGIKSKKQIKKYYGQYEKSYPFNANEYKLKFKTVIELLLKIFPEGLSNTEFSRVHLFYSVFVAIAHCLFGIPGMAAAAMVDLSTESAIEKARNGLDRVNVILVGDSNDLNESEKSLSAGEGQFLEDCRRATTDEKIRIRRSEFLLNLMAQ